MAISSVRERVVKASATITASLTSLSYFDIGILFLCLAAVLIKWILHYLQSIECGRTPPSSPSERKKEDFRNAARGHSVHSPLTTTIARIQPLTEIEQQEHPPRSHHLLHRPTPSSTVGASPQPCAAGHFPFREPLLFLKYFLISMGVILYWRGANNLLDRFFFRKHYVASQVISIVIGIVMLFSVGGLREFITYAP